MIRNSMGLIAAIAAFAAAAPSLAKSEPAPPVTLTKCETSYGIIAVVDGDTQGWTKYNLGSPRDLINALALESGCFTPAEAGGPAATFLMNVVAGDKEEIDRSINLATSAAKEGLARSGVLARAGGIGGSAIGGMLGRFGGKKKTFAAAIRLINPANGTTMVSGSGEVQKSTLTFGEGGGGLLGGGDTSGYASSKDGKMLIEAFIKAFNGVTDQGVALQAMRPAGS